jgi:hypothetical protein
MGAYANMGQEQDVDKALGLLDRLVVAAESIAESLVSLDESVSQIRYVLRGDEEEYRPPRATFDVELPDADAVLCPRCQTVRPVDPNHPGHPDVHDCVPWRKPPHSWGEAVDPVDPLHPFGYSEHSTGRAIKDQPQA